MNRDVHDRVRSANPVDPAALPAPDPADAARLRAVGTSGEPVTAPGRRRPPVGAVAGAVGLAALIGGLVLAMPRGGDAPPAAGVTGATGATDPATTHPPGKLLAVDVLDPGPSTELPAAGLTLESLRGRWVVLNFAASWCAPCRTQTDDLDQVARSVAPGAITLRVLVNDLEADARRTFLPNDHHMAVVLDPNGRMAAAYRVTAMPATVLLDPQGRTVARWDGPGLDGLTDLVFGRPGQAGLARFWASPQSASFREPFPRSPGERACRLPMGGPTGGRLDARCALTVGVPDGDSVDVVLTQSWDAADFRWGGGTTAGTLSHRWTYRVDMLGGVALTGEDGDAAPPVAVR